MIAPPFIALLGCCGTLLAACSAESDHDLAADGDTASETSDSSSDVSSQPDVDSTELPPVGDTAAPVPGGGGAIEVSGLTDVALVLTWAPASDDLTAGADLRYRVYRSSDHRLATLEEIDRHGLAIAEDPTALTRFEVTGLEMGEVYHLNVVVEDRAGLRSPYAAVEVRTLFRKVEALRWIYYQDGTIAHYWEHTFDANGLWTRRTSFSGPGGDATWLTSDDVISGLTTRTYTADHQLESEILYLDAGPDGAWFGTDDTPGSKRANSFDPAGNLVREAFYGGDGLVNGYRQHDYDEARRLVRTTHYYLPGPNGRWFDADDALQGSYTFAWDGERLVRTNNVGAGPDLRIGTDDDVIRSSRTTTYDLEGHPLEERYSIEAGPDGVWLSDDDVLAELTTRERSQLGERTRLLQVTYTAPGTDGAWSTPDDSANHAAIIDWDSQGRQVLIAEFTGPLAAGADGEYGTADDTSIWYYATTSYDEAGREVASLMRLVAGADDLWWTADDPVYSAATRVYSDDGTLLADQLSFPGPDGVPLTADDVPDERVEYTVIYTRDESPVLTP